MPGRVSNSQATTVPGTVVFETPPGRIRRRDTSQTTEPASESSMEKLTDPKRELGRATQDINKESRGEPTAPVAPIPKMVGVVPPTAAPNDPDGGGYVPVKRQKKEDPPPQDPDAGDDSDDCVFLGAVHVDLPEPSHKCTSRPAAKCDPKVPQDDGTFTAASAKKEPVEPVTPLPATPMSQHLSGQAATAVANNMRRASTASQMTSPSVNSAAGAGDAGSQDASRAKKPRTAAAPVEPRHDEGDEEEEEKEDADDGLDEEEAEDEAVANGTSATKNKKGDKKTQQPKGVSKEEPKEDNKKEKGKGSRTRKPKTEEQKKLHARFMRFTRSIQRALSAPFLERLRGRTRVHTRC